MTEKAGFLGLGTAGGLVAGAVGIVAAVGVLYATGTLSPVDVSDGEPVAVVAVPEQTEPSGDAPAPDTAAEAPAPEEEAATPAQPAPADEETATAPEPVEDTAAAPVEESATTEPEPEPAPSAEDTAAEQEAVTQAPGTEEAEAPAVEPLRAPSFDVVRAAPDGSTLVAGQGAPGSLVTVLVDGQDADTQTVDQGGDFVSFLSLGASTAPRIVSLIARLGDEEARSVEEIILAPTPAPQVTGSEPAAPSSDEVADAATTDEPTAQATENAIEEPAGEEPTETARAEAGTDDPAPAPTANEAEAEPAPAPVETANAEPVSTDDTPVASATDEQVSEPTSVAVLRADADGVELLQPATPAADAVQALALDTIGYSPEGDVLLSGRAGPRTPIRIYLDNAAVADLTSEEDGRWRARLSGIEPGVYTLRLDALDADGGVTSRLETPFLRESPEALAAAQTQVETPPAAPTQAGQTASDTTAPTATPAPVAPIRQVTVQAGDTLWAISRERYGDGLLYVRVFEANRSAIRDPDLIYPGQIFTIPE